MTKQQVALWVCGALAVAGLSIFLAVDANSRSVPVESVAATSVPVMSYCWYGSAEVVDVTFQNASGNTQQQADRANNQCLELGTVPAGSFLYLSAQITSSSGGTVRCQIRADGKIVEQAASEGDYVIATCSGRA